MDVVVINLDKSKDRMKKIKKNLDDLHIPFTRFKAIYGKELDQETINNTTTLQCRTILCNFGIVGCGLSHTSVWKKFYNNDDANFLCVLEDDAIVNKKFPTFLNDVPSIYQKLNFDMISLYCDGPLCGFFGKDQIIVDTYTFEKPLFPLSAACYVISRKGCEKLLNLIHDINYNIDFMIAQESFFGKIDYYVLKDAMVTITSEESSIAELENKGVLIKMLSGMNMKHAQWILSLPIFTINLRKSITVYMILLFVLIYIFLYKKAYVIATLLIIELLMVSI